MGTTVDSKGSDLLFAEMIFPLKGKETEVFIYQQMSLIV